MALPVIVEGKSGSGKSSSLRSFGEKEVILFNTEGKELPFRQRFVCTTQTDSTDTIIDWCKKGYENGIKTAVVDDAGYLMTHYFMDNHRTKTGNSSFEMYDSIADLIYFLIKRIKAELPEDMIVYIVFHEDTNDYGDTRIKTIGKLLDSKVCIEGMVTIVIRCMSDMGRHFFRTVTDGNDVTKTPMGMFEEAEIDNDLKLVNETIRRYYGWDNKTNEEEKS